MIMLTHYKQAELTQVVVIINHSHYYINKNNANVAIF